MQSIWLLCRPYPGKKVKAWKKSCKVLLYKWFPFLLAQSLTELHSVFFGIKVDRCLFHDQFDSFWTTVLFFSRSVISLHWVRILSRLLFDFSPRLVFGTLNAVLNHATVRARPSQRYVWLKDFDFMLFEFFRHYFF